MAEKNGLVGGPGGGLNPTPMSATCCCGCPVRTGTKFIAAVWLVYYFLQVINLTYLLLALINYERPSLESEDQEVKLGYLIMPYDPSGSTTFVFLAVLLVVSAINLVLSGLLLFGAYKDKIQFCTPWLQFNCVLFMVYVFASIVLIFGLLAWISVPFTAGIAYSVCIFFNLVLYAYLIRVVNQYITQLRQAMALADGIADVELKLI